MFICQLCVDFVLLVLYSMTHLLGVNICSQLEMNLALKVHVICCCH